MLNKLKIPIEYLLIIIFALAKLFFHLFTIDNFELHRDAYLYYALSENLAWGYISVPPSIAVIGKIATSILGNTVFALRFFPAIIGSITLLLTGLFVKELGGKKAAISIACLGFLLSPAYLHTNALFQPVAFDHFYWVLSCYVFLLLIKREQHQTWLWIALVFALAFLNKYTIVFLYLSFGISLLLSRHRRLIFSRYFLFCLILGIALILPNLFWQFENNWPVLQHMAELRETQLVHVNHIDFILAQFLMNIQALILWVVAILLLLFLSKEKIYRVFGLTFCLVILLILLGSGKGYYTLGIYPMLIAFGAYFIEKYVQRWFYPLVIIVVLWMVSGLYLSLPYDGVPILSAEQLENKNAFKWEDGVYHNIPQDVADMTGWKEIGTTVAKIYSELGNSEKNNCAIYCYNYGQAGAVMFYGKEANVPQPIAPTDNFVLWAPDSLDKEYVIYVHSDLCNDVNPEERLSQIFESYELLKTIDNKYFREKGTKIFLAKYPKQEAKDFHKKMIGELKENYKR